MSEPIRITKSASATDIVDSLGWVGEQIQERAVKQTRQDVADALRDSFVDRGYTAVHYSDTPDDAIISTLRDAKSITRHPSFQGLADRFDQDGVPADFRLGLLFAIYLAKDPEFEL